MGKMTFATVAFVVAILVQGANSATFTIKNNCPYTVWPATLSSSGTLFTTGFKLDTDESLTVQATPKWSGRVWTRTGCTADSSGKFTCQTGDCGSGEVECGGRGGRPPATLAEFTLQGDDDKDFYDTSLVDGYNVPLSIAPRGVPGCKKTGCPVDVNARCPPELQARSAGGGVVGCKSACFALGGKQYCCTEEYNDPKVCKPTNYSKVFKDVCPLAYSYPYDDATSTFTCVGANYVITFCP